MTIFTNGCFDIIHRGHIELLNYCKSLGDRVIVGINSDRFVSKLKGPSRPINTAEDRRHHLLALRYVDDVIIFDDVSPLELIRRIRPDIIVKGGDYNARDVVGCDIAAVIIFKTVGGYSTSETIKNIANR